MRWLQNFWDDWGMPLFFFLVIVLVTVAVISGVSALERADCIGRTANIGYEYRWLFFGGCQIEITPGQWIPLDSYYFREAE